MKPGECTKLHWSVENVDKVFLNNSPTTGKDTRDVCLTQTTTFTLRVVSSAGTQKNTATLTVSAEDQLAIETAADTYQVIKGQCANIRWRVTDVQEVFFDGKGVAGDSSKRYALRPRRLTSCALGCERRCHQQTHPDQGAARR